MEDAQQCSHIPEHLQDLITKFEEEEKDGNPFTNSPEVVPAISVAARIVQIRSSSNEQGQPKEHHSDGIQHEGKAERTRTSNDFTTLLMIVQSSKTSQKKPSCKCLPLVVQHGPDGRMQG